MCAWSGEVFVVVLKEEGELGGCGCWKAQLRGPCVIWKGTLLASPRERDLLRDLWASIEPFLTC